MTVKEEEEKEEVHHVPKVARQELHDSVLTTQIKSLDKIPTHLRPR